MANKNMKTYIVIASVNPLDNIKAFEPELLHHNCEVIVVDEGNGSVRKENEKLLSSLKHKYYGPTERTDWFKKRFGSSYADLLSVVPERCHAETSFGFLVAFEDKPDVILEVDDDVFPSAGHALVDAHVRNLACSDGVTVGCRSKWYSNFMGIDRFDDIWSGVFIKKIADHLGRKISLGSPLLNHRKRPRDTLKDLRKEFEGMVINEKLWTLVDQIELGGSTYWDAYGSLIQELGKKITQIFTEPLHRDFLEVQLQKMKLWLKIIDHLD